MKEEGRDAMEGGKEGKTKEGGREREESKPD